MTYIRVFEKDPNAVLDYPIDWSSWLGTGETIYSSSWTVPAGITKLAESATSTVTTIWLSGGTVGDYEITNRITTTTSPARVEDRTFLIQVRER